MNMLASLDENICADNSKSTRGHNDTGEDSDNEDEDKDDDEDAPSPSRQQVCDLSIVCHYLQLCHMCTVASGKHVCQFSHNRSLVSASLIQCLANYLITQCTYRTTCDVN